MNSLVFLVALTPLLLIASPALAATHIHVPKTSGTDTTTTTKPTETIKINPIQFPKTTTPDKTSSSSSKTTTPTPTPSTTPPKITQCPNGQVQVNGQPPCPKQKFPCPPSTPNNTSTCIFIIHKTTVKHANSVQQVPQAVFITDLGFVIPVQCKLYTSPNTL
jgi:hypothetical protein